MKGFSKSLRITLAICLLGGMACLGTSCGKKSGKFYDKSLAMLEEAISIMEDVQELDSKELKEFKKITKKKFKKLEKELKKQRKDDSGSYDGEFGMAVKNAYKEAYKEIYEK